MKNKFLQSYLLFIGIALLMIGCNNDSYLPDPERGADLATTYCTSCHALPAPDRLPKIIWEQHILPQKAYLLGFYNKKTPRDSLLNGKNPAVLAAQQSAYPEEALISDQDWINLQAYYLQNAPTALAPINTSVIQPELPLFEVRLAPIKISPPSTSLTRISRKGGFFIADANSQSLYQFDDNYEVSREAKTGEVATDLNEFASTLALTVQKQGIGQEDQSGFLLGFPKEKDRPAAILIPKLNQPLHSLPGVFLDQPNSQFVIAETAKWTGQLALWSVQNGRYTPTVLKKGGGAIRSVATDFNSDGRLDVVSLFGKGTEGLFVFYNQGDGTFQEEQLLAFDVSFGATYFNMQDLDRDNDLDIVITNGDPGLHPPVLKREHGIRFFTNDGNNHFKESFFYSLPGAKKAITADFDQDGDLDVAAIAFYPDFQNHPEQAFVYLENQGNDQFIARTFQEVRSGRWMTMDAGDIDLDGDLDLLLGAFAQKTEPPVGLFEQWVEKGIPFIVLENQLK